MTATPTRAQIEREIAEGLDRLADAILAKANRGEAGWAIRRHDARVYRLCADHVRAGLYLEERKG